MPDLKQINEALNLHCRAQTVSQTILSHECQYVVDAGGDHFFALTQDHETPFTIPVSKVKFTIRGLEAGHRSGIQRHPIPVHS